MNQSRALHGRGSTAPAIAALAAGLMGLALAGCAVPAESPVALSDPGRTPIDQALIGTWYSADEAGRQAVVLHILPRPEAPEIFVVATTTLAAEDETESGAHWLAATGYPSRVGDRTYFNLRRVKGLGLDYTAEGEEPGFVIVRLAPSEAGTLRLCPLYLGLGHDDAAAKTRPGREVEGRFQQTGDSEPELEPYVVLDLDRDKLAAFVAQVPLSDGGLAEIEGDAAFICFPPFHKAAATAKSVWPY